jgi:hypothetical protein
LASGDHLTEEELSWCDFQQEKEATKIVWRVGFRSRTQMPLFMLWKEWRTADGEADFEKIKLILDWP